MSCFDFVAGSMVLVDVSSSECAIWPESEDGLTIDAQIASAGQSAMTTYSAAATQGEQLYLTTMYAVYILGWLAVRTLTMRSPISCLPT